MNYQKKIKEVKKYILAYFNQFEDERLLYHNIQHTKNVVAACKEISAHYDLEKDDYFALITAAWFHDTGYLSGKDSHEEKGANVAKKFLEEISIPQELIEKVIETILATKSPQKPSSEIENIICDADLFHLGTNEFKKENKLLKEECETLEGITIPDMEWQEKDLIFLKSHRYHTVYCQNLLNTYKMKNIEQLQKKLEKETALKNLEDAKKEKNERPERGIETMFRITSGNNQRLSDMADNKAHILITVNSIILSIIISLLLRKLETNQYLIIPTLFLLTSCLVAMVFSILATRPSVPHGKFYPQEMEHKTVNLLFFGNFYNMHLEDYSSGMWQVMKDHDFLYNMLIKDVFGQGVVLGKKYKLLRIAYNVFMYGLIISVIAFAIAQIGY